MARIDEHYLTEEEVMTYKDHFASFDQDGDGVITNVEMFHLLKTVHPGMDEGLMNEIMVAVDTNRDQVIDFPEFLQLMSLKRRNVQAQKRSRGGLRPQYGRDEDNLTEEEIATYKEHFRIFDKDGDGVITYDEMFVLIKRVHPGTEDDLIYELVAAVDTNRDQVVDFPEFLQLMSVKSQIQQDREVVVLPEKLSVRLFGEFVGTYILVFTVGCNVLTKQGVWGGTSIGCVLMVMIYALGGACGAHFNPAVSFSLWVSKKMEANEFAMYAAVQIIAGIAAGLSYLAIFSRSFNLQPAPGHDIYQAGIAEIFYTFMLCFTVLNCAASKSDGEGKNEYYGLAIGFVVIAGAYGAGSVSMGCFNPAVAFGIDVSSAWYGVYYCFVYTLYELVGALLACAMFWLCRPEEYDNAVRKDENGKVIYPLSSKLAAEFLGTFMLVLTVGLNVLSDSPAAAFSIAASLMCMIFALGSVSGAHFNPAVTIAVIASGRDKLKPGDGIFYVVVQLIAGMCGGFVYWCLINYEAFRLGPQPGFSWWQACYAEFMFTFVLCFVVLSVATTKEPKSAIFGLAIGSCVTVGGFAVGNVSGGSLNPAVSFGIASAGVGFSGAMRGAMIYAVVEMLAGIVAAAAFMGTRPSEYVHASKESAVYKETYTMQGQASRSSHRV